MYEKLNLKNDKVKNITSFSIRVPVVDPVKFKFLVPVPATVTAKLYFLASAPATGTGAVFGTGTGAGPAHLYLGHHITPTERKIFSHYIKYLLVYMQCMSLRVRVSSKQNYHDMCFDPIIDLLWCGNITL